MQRYQLEQSSRYAGSTGLRMFLQCSKLKVTGAPPSERVLKLFDGPPPPSFVDVLEVARFDFPSGWVFSDEKIGLLSEMSSVDYEWVSIDHKQNGEFDGKEYFIYTKEQESSSVFLKPKAWNKDLIVFGGVEGAGRLFLLNPSVRTIDGEYEVYLMDWRAPGARRFLSVAELLAHLYHYHAIQTGEDEFRFGSDYPHSHCVRFLFDGAQTPAGP